MAKETDTIILFYSAGDRVHGHMCNWYPCHFVEDARAFNCSEQYFMACKASLFGDQESLNLIMESNSPGYQKAVGKQVEGYEDDIWAAYRVSCMFCACWLKYTQNPMLRDALLRTGSKILVEASPTDKVWGIGLSEADPRAIEHDMWRGHNLLGQVLMDVRTALRTMVER